MTIRDSGETLRDLAETAWQMILCLQARSQRGRTGLALGDYVLKLTLIDQQGSKWAITIYQRSSLLRPMVEEIESLKDGGIGLELLDKVCPGARLQALKLVEKRIRVVLPRGAFFTW